MAEGLSIPALSPGPNQGFHGLTNQPRAPGDERPAPADPGDLFQVSDGENLIRDVLDLGNDFSLPEQLIPPGGFQLDSSGLYQFSRFSASASIDISLSQNTAQISAQGGQASALASLTEINISISVSAELERALIDAGRSEEGDVEKNFRAASQAVVDRFVARQVRATLNFNLSFSQSTLAFSSTGQGLEDLSGLASDGSLAGFLSLIKSFFGDDERFDDFINRIEEFLNSFQSGQAQSPEEAGRPVAAATRPDGGQQIAVQASRLDVSVDLSVESTSIEIRSQQQSQGEDPIVLDLDSDGIELTTAAKGARFDLNADGVRERTAVPTGGDGFLALDRNGNGKIDNGKELFGDQNGAANGFQELARFDSNSDGVIDPRDVVFDNLKVFVDRNLDGVSQTDELVSLPDLGISAINLLVRDVSEEAAGGNRIAQRSFFTREDGTRGQIVDALLNQFA